jgi:hypothetical protein
MKAIVTIESSISEAADNSLESSELGTERARPRSRGSWLKSMRLLHRYMGLFFSPAILFFAFSGALQTFNLHKTDARTGYTPPMWIQEIAQIHKSQNMNVRTKSKPKKAESDTADPELNDAPAPKKGAKPDQSALPMKWFVVIMSAGLIVTTALGIYMSFSYGGYPRLAWVALIAGVVVPIAFLMF